MKSLWIEQNIKYDGTQLKSLFAYLGQGILGDSVVSWQGSCQIEPEHMIDGEDLLAKAEICGDQMVHFIVEKFDCTLFAAVALQRVMASLALDSLRELSKKTELTSGLYRDGDDIFVGSKKFSISIATQSPVSSLIHFAVNVVNEGTPVETISLSDFEIEPKVYAEKVMAKLTQEVRGVIEATQKVRWVK